MEHSTSYVFDFSFLKFEEGKSVTGVAFLGTGGGLHPSGKPSIWLILESLIVDLSIVSLVLAAKKN